jgi:hypothetical protein
MPSFQVTMKDRTVEHVDDADAYAQEGPMTTFFRNGPGREVVDCWSTRIASFRTADLVIVRRLDADRTAPTARPIPASGVAPAAPLDGLAAR